MEILVKSRQCKPLDQGLIADRLLGCARLPSLGSIDRVLRELVNAEQCFTSQVADVIRRDPSMTTRLLRLVNSVYFGLAVPVSSIEDAVFYLGVRQVRQLAMVTPVIEDLQKMGCGAQFTWHAFWQHCVGVAILTPEILGDVQSSTDETDYVSGLLHDVGKIVMGAIFPQHFAEIREAVESSRRCLLEIESEILGMNHTELGAMYLRNHHLPAVTIKVAQFHHEPELAGEHRRYVAAVQIADLLVRRAGIGDSGNPILEGEEDSSGASGWKILFPQNTEQERAMAQANLDRSLERLPAILEGLV